MPKNYNLVLFTILLSSCFSQPPANVIDKAQNVYSKKGTVQYKQVKPGETLKLISKQYHVLENDILEANGLKKGSEVLTGMSLIIPTATAYANFNSSVSSSSAVDEITESFLSPLKPASSLNKTENNELIVKNNLTPAQNNFESEKPAPDLDYFKTNSIEQPVNNDLDLTKDHSSVIKENDTPFKATYKLNNPLGLNRFNWPVKGQLISRYGKNGNKYNDGINIKADLGTPVSAIDNGKVIYTGNNTEGYGNLAIIKHDGDYLSAYAHLSEINVERGSTIAKGDLIGTVGKSGNVAEPQLHFSIRKGKKTIDPEGIVKN